MIQIMIYYPDFVLVLRVSWVMSDMLWILYGTQYHLHPPFTPQTWYISLHFQAQVGIYITSWVVEWSNEHNPGSDNYHNGLWVCNHSALSMSDLSLTCLWPVSDRYGEPSLPSSTPQMCSAIIPGFQAKLGISTLYCVVGWSMFVRAL